MLLEMTTSTSMVVKVSPYSNTQVTLLLSDTFYLSSTFDMRIKLMSLQQQESKIDFMALIMGH